MRDVNGAYYPNLQGSQPAHGAGFTGIPVQCIGQPPSRYPPGNQYPTYAHPSYRLSYPTANYKDTSHLYKYQTPVQKSHVDSKSPVERYSMEKANMCSPQYPQCPSGQQFLPPCQNSTKQICPVSHPQVGYRYAPPTYPNHCVSFNSSMSSEKVPGNYSHQPAHTPPIPQYPTFPQVGSLQRLKSHGEPVSSTQKRAAEYCEPSQTPVKKQCVDQNTVPYSVQLNGYQEGMQIQGSCYLTVTKDTQHHKNRYQSGPTKVETLTEMYPGKNNKNLNTAPGHNNIDLSVFNVKNHLSGTSIKEQEFTHPIAKYIVHKVVQLTMKYMPHVKPRLVSMTQNNFICLPDATCSKLLTAVNPAEKLVLEVYNRYKPKICSIINKNGCVFHPPEHQMRSSDQFHKPGSSAKQNYCLSNSGSFPTNIGNGSSGCAPSPHRSDILIHHLMKTSVPTQCSKSISPAVNVFSPGPNCLPSAPNSYLSAHSPISSAPGSFSSAHSPISSAPGSFSSAHSPISSAPGSFSSAHSPISSAPGSFSSAPNNFAPPTSHLSPIIGAPSSTNSPCTFLSESEFRDQPCRSANVPVVKNITHPPAFENITPPPEFCYQKQFLNDAKLHSNPRNGNHNHHQLTAHTLPEMQNHQPFTHLRGPISGYDASPKPTPCVSQSGMRDINDRQHDASMMKLPETIPPQQPINDILSKLKMLNDKIKLPSEPTRPVHNVDINVFSIQPPTVVNSSAHFSTMSPKSISNSKSPESLADSKPGSSNTTVLTDSDTSLVRCFTVWPPTDEPVNQTNEPTEDSKNFAVKAKVSQNLFQGKVFSGMALPVQEECITICDSDEETDIHFPGDEIDGKMSSLSNIQSAARTLDRSTVFSPRTALPGDRDSETQKHFGDNCQANLKTNSTVSADDDKNTSVNSEFTVGGTTFAAFTIDDDQLEMIPQEFGIDMLEMLVNCG